MKQMDTNLKNDGETSGRGEEERYKGRRRGRRRDTKGEEGVII